MSVFPVPGGPYSKTPFGALIPTLLKSSGLVIGSSIVYFELFFEELKLFAYLSENSDLVVKTSDLVEGDIPRIFSKHSVDCGINLLVKSLKNNKYDFFSFWKK